jgi:hypothetical protein
MARAWARLVGFSVILLIWGWGDARAVSPAAPSAPVLWSDPVNLSDTPESSSHPAIVADAYGYVHVFWSEEVGGKPMRPQEPLKNGNTIFYTRWDGDAWIPPVDVLFVPGDDVAEFISVAVDPQNRLHAVWTGQTNIYYSHAPAWKADSGHAWSKPIALSTDSARSMYESHIVADATGGLHVLYATRFKEPGVYYTRSLDGGINWQSAIRLSAPLEEPETSVSHVQIITDQAGRLHAVWQTNQQQGYGQAVYYARSVNGGEEWSPPLLIAYREPEDFSVDWPYLTAVGESVLHLIYSDGPRPWRFHRLSTDAGETWSEPTHILTELEGTAGYTIPVADAAGQVHLLIDMRTIETQIGGIYYARWLGDQWSQPEPVLVSDPILGSAHFMAAALRLGNELHIVWNDIAGGDIGYMQGVISAVTPLSPLAPPSETPTPVTPTATKPVPAVITPEPKATAEPVTFTFTDPPLTLTTNIPLILGSGTALLLVAGVVLWVRMRAS